MNLVNLILLFITSALAQPVVTTTAQRHFVSANQANTILKACAAEAVQIKSPSSIAVTDPSGLLVGFLRNDDTIPLGIDVSVKKARTVSLFNGRYTTAELYNLTIPGGPVYGECFSLLMSLNLEQMANDVICRRS